jgi:hypothetical protein
MTPTLYVAVDENCGQSFWLARAWLLVMLPQPAQTLHWPASSPEVIEPTLHCPLARPSQRSLRVHGLERQPVLAPQPQASTPVGRPGVWTQPDCSTRP